MASQSLLDTTSLRSLQILGGADSQLSDPTDTALHGADAILPQSLIGSLPVGGLTDTTPTVPDGVATATPVVQTVETLLGNATGDVGSTSGVSTGVLGPVNGVVSGVQGLGTQGLEALANEAILDIHATLEGASDAGNLPYTIHGITNLGEAIGLGKLGGDNLLTDLIALPTALLNGNLGPIENLPHDLSGIVTATQGLLSGVETDLASGALLADPVGSVTGALSQISTLPLTSLANDLVGTIHATLEGALDPVANGTIHGITGLGNALGLGELGGNNLLTDATSLPSSLLAGDLSPVTHLPGDVGSVVGAAASALDGVGSDLGGGLLHGVTDPTTGGGLLGGVLPGQDAANGLLGQVEGVVNGVGSATGLGDVTQAATTAVGGSNGLVGDILHAPGAVLGGAGSGAEPIPGDIGTTVGSLGSIVGAAGHDVAGLGSGANGLLAPVEGALQGGTGALAPVQSAVNSVLHGDTGGLLAPLQGVANGVLPGGDANGLVGTTTGLLGGGTGSGSHDLATVAVGPQTSDSGLALDVLSQGNGQTHLIDSHVGTAGASTPTVATVGLLSGDSLHIPGASTGGSDALHGVLGAVSGAGAPTAGGADANAGIDLGAAHVDLPITAIHAHPLEALAAPVAHAA